MKSLFLHIKNFRLLFSIALVGKKLKGIPLFPIILDEQLKVVTFFFHPLKFKKMKEFVDEIIKTEALKTEFHRYGGIEFHFNKTEIGHMHSNGLLDISFAKPIRDLLISKKLCKEHHIYPASGWTSFYINKDSDLQIPFQLIRWSKQLATKIKSLSQVLGEINDFKKSL